MPAVAPIRVYLDTSVLINFLAVDRAELLGTHPKYRFVVTNHVRGDNTAQDPERLACFETALMASYIDQTAITAPEELDAFARLVATNRLGVGECAAIAGAVVADVPVAIEDRVARKLILQLFPKLQIVDTLSVMRSLIESGSLDVTAADAIKDEWEAKHRFKLPIKSFADPA